MSEGTENCGAFDALHGFVVAITSFVSLWKIQIQSFVEGGQDAQLGSSKRFVDLQNFGKSPWNVDEVAQRETSEGLGTGLDVTESVGDNLEVSAWYTINSLTMI